MVYQLVFQKFLNKLGFYIHIYFKYFFWNSDLTPLFELFCHLTYIYFILELTKPPKHENKTYQSQWMNLCAIPNERLPVGIKNNHKKIAFQAIYDLLISTFFSLYSHSGHILYIYSYWKRLNSFIYLICGKDFLNLYNDTELIKIIHITFYKHYK